MPDETKPARNTRAADARPDHDAGVPPLVSAARHTAALLSSVC